MQLSVYDINGKGTGQIEADDAVFASPFNPALLHQAVVYYQANQRQGTSNTLRRGEVSGGGRKPFAQKGTGRARQGSIRSPLQRHGGVAFGPHPRSYRQRMPKRMRQQAMRVALSAKLANDRLWVIAGLENIEPRTNSLASVLQAFSVTGSALVVVCGQQEAISRASRNIPRVKAIQSDLLNALDLLRYETVLMTADSVNQANTLWADTSRPPRKVKIVVSGGVA